MSFSSDPLGISNPSQHTGFSLNDGSAVDPNNLAQQPHTVTNEVGAPPEPKGAQTVTDDWTKKPGRYNGPNCASRRPTK